MDHPCSNCGNAVKARRPSQSGKHFCPRPQCQTAKQRFYRKAQNKAVKQTLLEVAAEFVRDLVQLERRECPGCGLPNAVPGWAHRDATGLAPCFAVGSQGSAIPELLDVVHPERRPS